MKGGRGALPAGAAVALALLLGSAGCYGPAPRHIEPRPTDPDILFHSAAWRRATRMVVADLELVRADPTMREMVNDSPRRPNGRDPVALTCWRVRVVASLRGPLQPHRRYDIWFYRLRPGLDVWPKRGSRLLLFLTEDGGVLRAAVDGYPFFFEDLPRRQLPAVALGEGRAPEELVAPLLLDRTAGESDREYLSGFARRLQISETFSGFLRTRRILARLLHDPSPAVAARACLHYYQDYLGERFCADRWTAASKAWKAEFENARERREHNLSRLADYRQFLATRGYSPAPDAPVAIWRELAQSSDSAVAAPAQAGLLSWPFSYHEHESRRPWPASCAYGNEEVRPPAGEPYCVKR